MALDFKRIKAFVLEGWTSYVSVSIGILLLLAIVGLVIENVVSRRAKRLSEKHTVMQNKPIDCLTVAGTQERASFIKEQRDEIAGFANNHRATAVEFFTYFHTTYLLFTIFGLIAAISLAAITKTGINNASPHLITVFLVCTAIVVLYQGSIGVFQHKNNIDDNTKLSISYAVLASQIDTYCVTGRVNVADPNDAFKVALAKTADISNKSANNGNNSVNQPSEQQPGPLKIEAFDVELTGQQFINYINWQTQKLRSFAISLDDTKVGAIDSKQFILQ